MSFYQEFPWALHMSHDEFRIKDAKRTVTHLCMSGGKFQFLPTTCTPPETVTISSSGITKTDDDQEKKAPTRDIALIWPRHRHFLMGLHFRNESMTLRGSHATIEEMFWVAYTDWVRFINDHNTDDDAPPIRLCLVETIKDCPVFKMFVDIDIEDNNIMDEDWIWETTPERKGWTSFVTRIVKLCGSAVKVAYPATNEDELVMTILTTGSWSKTKKGTYKRGIHVVWPRLYVTKETALRLVHIMNVTFLEKGPPRCPTRGQNIDIFDQSVYNVGLRMPGCPKAELCPTCGKNRHKVSDRGGKNDEMRTQSFVKAGTSHRHDADASTLTVRLVMTARNFCPTHLPFPQGFMFRKATIYHIRKCIYPSGKKASNPDPKAVTFNASKGGNFCLGLKELASIRCGPDVVETPGFNPPDRLRTLFPTLPTNPSDPRLRCGINFASGNYVTGVKRVPLLAPEQQLQTKKFRIQRELLVPVDLKIKIQTICRRFCPQHNRILLYNFFAQRMATKEEVIVGYGPVKYLSVKITVTGEGSTYCPNKGAAHRSSTIWYGIDHQCQIVTGCWSTHSYHNRCCRTTTSNAFGHILRVTEDVEKKALYDLLNCALKYSSEDTDTS